MLVHSKNPQNILKHLLCLRQQSNQLFLDRMKLQQTAEIAKNELSVCVHFNSAYIDKRPYSFVDRISNKTQLYTPVVRSRYCCPCKMYEDWT